MTSTVDYAHTPESVVAVLRSVRSLAGSRRCMAVVGCSGNSDRGKRAPIARAAAAGSDRAFFTSDNPNHEHPASSCATWWWASAPAFRPTACAIAAAIEDAMRDGVVVLLGKGTETYQLVNSHRQPHNDAAAAARVLRSLEAQHNVLNRTA